MSSGSALPAMAGRAARMPDDSKKGKDAEKAPSKAPGRRSCKRVRVSSSSGAPPGGAADADLDVTELEYDDDDDPAVVAFRGASKVKSDPKVKSDSKITGPGAWCVTVHGWTSNKLRTFLLPGSLVANEDGASAAFCMLGRARTVRSDDSAWLSVRGLFDGDWKDYETGGIRDSGTATDCGCIVRAVTFSVTGL